MEMKKEEGEFPISGTEFDPLDGQVEVKQENVDNFSIAGEIKEEPFPNNVMDDSPLVCSNEFGFNESMEGEESRLKMEEGAGSMEPPVEEGALPDVLYLKRIQTIRDIVRQKTRKSSYQKDTKDRLEAALYAMCIGELTSSEAIDKFDVPSRTFYNYSKEIQTSMAMSGIFSPKKSTYSTEMRETFAEKETTIQEDETLPIVKGPPFDPSDLKRIQTIRDAIIDQTKICRKGGDWRDRIQAALYAVCIGELTTTEAYDKFGFPSKTLHPHLRKIRQSLGTILPPQKPNSILPSVLNSIKIKTIQEEETVTIDGITVPISISILTEFISNGRIDYSEAKPFLGSKEKLREKLITILQALNFGGVLTKLVDGIMSVYVDGKTIYTASRIHKFNQKTLSEYATAVKIFIDFAKSPCSWEYRTRTDAMVLQALPLGSGKMESPQPLPRPTVEKIIVMKEKVDDDYRLIKEEQIEPPVKKIKEE